MLNKTIIRIKDKIDLFDSFEHIYIFGSILIKKDPNDIDVLLIYSDYSDKLLSEFKLIKNAYQTLCETPFNFTVLSSNEEQELNFLKKIDSQLLKIK